MRIFKKITAYILSLFRKILSWVLLGVKMAIRYIPGLSYFAVRLRLRYPQLWQKIVQLLFGKPLFLPFESPIVQPWRVPLSALPPLEASYHIENFLVRNQHNIDVSKIETQINLQLALVAKQKELQS